MLFSTKSVFIANFLIENAPDNSKRNSLLRALLELSKVESCSSEFVYKLILYQLNTKGSY